MAAANQPSGAGFVYHRSGSAKREPPGSSGLVVRSSHPEQSSQTGLVAGVRGMGGTMTIERSEEEKSKHPDRINLDRKSLHGN